MKMETLSWFGLTILVVTSLVQANVVGGNSLSTCGGIFEGDSGEFEYHRKNENAEDSTGSSVCVWMIKLLTKDGAGVSLKLEDLDENSVVNFYAEGEPTDPVNTPNTLNSSQINSAVELSGRSFIITLTSQLDQFENSPTKFVVSWTSLDQLSTVESNSNSSKILPVELTSTNYFAAGGEKGRYNFKNFQPNQKSVWILDAGFGGSLDAEVNVQFDSSCLSKFKSKEKSQMSPKALCECSYFGLFEIVQSTGKLRSVNDFCGRSGSLQLTKLPTQLIVFMYSMNPTSGSGESAQISWGKSKETTNPTTTTQKTTTEFQPTPEPPIETFKCPQNSTISPCTCLIGLGYQTRIDCSGSAVNESSIENTFREIRRVNGVPEDRGISILEFRVEQTELTQLDLAPFYGSNMYSLYFHNNYNLTTFVTSGNPRDHGSIQVSNLRLDSSPLSRSGFGDTLKYFSNEMFSFYAKGFDLNEYNDSFEDEFLPGLSAHTNLRDFSFSSSNISGRLTADTLIPKELQNLGRINLLYDEISEIGENAFDFEGHDDALNIDLRVNNLNQSSFHLNSGIARAGRQTTLELDYNQISTLPAPVFEAFLDAHPQNSLSLFRNRLICDERLSWLKSRREEFESRVIDVVCSNDEGHTVFDSDLIP